MRKLGWQGALLLSAMGAAAFWVFLSSGACDAVAIHAVEKSDASACWEYWFNRYQSLIGTGIAAIAALIAYKNFLAEQTREKEGDRRIGKIFYTRLQSLVVELEHCWSLQGDVDENLVRLTREDIEYNRPDPRHRFNNLFITASEALKKAENTQQSLKNLLMEVTDGELEKHLQTHQLFINSMINCFSLRISHARRAVDFAAVVNQSDWHLPEYRQMKQLLDRFRDAALARAGELAKID